MKYFEISPKGGILAANNARYDVKVCMRSIAADATDDDEIPERVFRQGIVEFVAPFGPAFKAAVNLRGTLVVRFNALTLINVF